MVKALVVGDEEDISSCSTRDARFAGPTMAR